MIPLVSTAIAVDGALPAQPAPSAGAVTRIAVTAAAAAAHALAATTSLVRISVSGAAVRWLQGADGDVLADGGTLPSGVIDTRSVTPGSTLRFQAVSADASVEIEEA